MRHIRTKIRFLTPDEGGRHSNVLTRYRPQFYYETNPDGTDWDAQHEFINVAGAAPGETIETYVSFMSPEKHVDHIKEGMEFKLREGHRVVAEGVVTQILGLVHPLRMYILVKDTIPLGLAVNSVGHSTLACYRKFQDDPDMQEWISSPSFKKVTCSVPDGQFQAAKGVQDHIVMTERALDGAETCIAFCPRYVYPKHFSFFQLFGANLKKEIDSLRAENKMLKEQMQHLIEAGYK